MIKPVRKTITTSLLLGALALATPACDIIEKEPIENCLPIQHLQRLKELKKLLSACTMIRRMRSFWGGVP